MPRSCSLFFDVKKGFTLIELIVVLSVIGFVTAMAAPALQNLPNTRAVYAIRKLRSDVRYIQLLAIHSQTRTRVVFDTGADTYSLERETSPGTWAVVTNPATTASYQETFNAGDYEGVDLTAAVFNATSSVIFNTLGAPFDGGGTAITEPAYAELNVLYRLNFRADTGKVDIT